MAFIFEDNMKIMQKYVRVPTMVSRAVYQS